MVKLEPYIELFLDAKNSNSKYPPLPVFALNPKFCAPVTLYENAPLVAEANEPAKLSISAP